MSLGWGAMGPGAWGGNTEPRRDDDSDSELGDGPSSKAPSAPPPPMQAPGPSQPASSGLPPGAMAAAAAASSQQQEQPKKKGLFNFGGGSSGPPPSAYPSAGGGMFAGSSTNNAAYEGPSTSFGAGGASLEARERDLAEREAKLKKLEEEIRAAGGFRKNNWPVCFPIWYHDIAGDIPDDSKRIVREVYMSWWGFLLCNSFQVFCATVMLGYKPDSNAIPSWFLSLIYWVAGLAGSLWLWYKRLYHACRNGTSAGYFVFFLFYFVHILWCTWCAIAIPVEAAAWSFSGFATAIAALDVHPFPGVIYIVGACLWVLEVLFCLWCIKDVYLKFRGRGGIKQAKQDAALEVFRAQQQGAAANGRPNPSPFGPNATPTSYNSAYNV